MEYTSKNLLACTGVLCPLVFQLLFDFEAYFESSSTKDFLWGDCFFVTDKICNKLLSTSDASAFASYGKKSKEVQVSEESIY